MADVILAVMKPHLPIQLSIPTPCHEDWAQMTPDERGRFCSHCQKSVVDFIGWTDAQLLEFFTAHKNTSVCGRFHSTQLNKNIYQRISAQHTDLYKYFVGLGLTLVFSQLPTLSVVAQTKYLPLITIDSQPTDTIRWKGLILCDTTGEAIANALVVITQGVKEHAQISTDINGSYQIKGLYPGRYNIHISKTGYDTLTVRDVIISPNRTLDINLKLPKANGEPITHVTAFRVPLIKPPTIDPNDSNKVLSAEDIENMPCIVTGMVNTENECYIEDGIVTLRRLNGVWTKVAKVNNGIVTQCFIDGKWVEIPRPNFFMRLWIHASIALRLRHPQARKYNQPL